MQTSRETIFPTNIIVAKNNIHSIDTNQMIFIFCIGKVQCG